MSGYDRRGSSRDPPSDRGGGYYRDERGGWDAHGGGRDARGHPGDGYGAPARDRDAGYAPRDDGYGGPDRGDRGGYGRHAPYDRSRDRAYDDYGYDRRGPPPGAYRDQDDPYYDRRGPPPASYREDPYGYSDRYDRRGSYPPRDHYDRGDPYRDDRGHRASAYDDPRRDDRDRDRDRGGGSEDPDAEITEHLQVPAEVAKMAIGMGGKAIKELQDRTGAHVMIYKPQPGDDRHMAHRPVMIKGRARAVAEAARELRQRCRQYHDQMDERERERDRDHGRARDTWDPRDDRRDDRRGRGGGSYGEEIVEERLECAPEHKGMVIGKGGQRVRRLEQDTGCVVNSDKDSPFITLRGTRRAIEKAKKDISAILVTVDLPPMPTPPGKDEPCAHEVKIPGEAIGQVMGFGGANIKRLQCVTGCWMNWDKPNRVMRVWGEPDKADVARDKLLEFVDQVIKARDEEVSARAGGGGYTRAVGVETVEIPARGQGGSVIGRGGVIVRRVEDSTGCRVRLVNEHDVVKLIGTPEQIDAARAQVLEVIERAIANQEDREGGRADEEGAPRARAEENRAATTTAAAAGAGADARADWTKAPEPDASAAAAAREEEPPRGAEESGY